MHSFPLAFGVWTWGSLDLATVSLADVTDLLRAIAWPLVVAFAILAVLSDRGRRFLRPVLRRIRKVSGPGGWGLELSEDLAIETRSDIQGAIASYTPLLDGEFERLAYQEDVRGRLESAATESLTAHQLTKANEYDYRATVHVRDALYMDALYQLVDYWPTGRGAGRRFSTRYGILGRAWRLRRSDMDLQVTAKPEELVREWGMTWEQATKATRDRKSFVAVILRHDAALVGVLFMDATEEQAFPRNFKETLDKSDQVKDLAAAVGRVHQKIASRGPGIKLLESD